MWSIITQVTMTTMSERLQIKRVRQECGKFRSKFLLCYDKHKGYYKNNLSIGHLNVNSILGKIDKVIDILNECHFNILFLSETKLDNSVSSTLLSNPHYRIIHRDRKRGAGGLLVYIRNSVVARHEA